MTNINLSLLNDKLPLIFQSYFVKMKLEVSKSVTILYHELQNLLAKTL